MNIPVSSCPFFLPSPHNAFFPSRWLWPILELHVSEITGRTVVCLALLARWSAYDTNPAVTRVSDYLLSLSGSPWYKHCSTVCLSVSCSQMLRPFLVSGYLDNAVMSFCASLCVCVSSFNFHFFLKIQVFQMIRSHSYLFFLSTFWLLALFFFIFYKFFSVRDNNYQMEMANLFTNVCFIVLRCLGCFCHAKFFFVCIFMDSDLSFFSFIVFAC